MITDKKNEKLYSFFNQIFDTFKEGICVSDCDGTVLYLNDKYEQIAKMSSQDILGQSVEKACRTGVFDFVVNPEVVKLKKPVTGIQAVRTGKNLFLDGYPIFDEQGEVTLVVTVIRDMSAITELKSRIDFQQKQLSAFLSLKFLDKTNPPKVLHTKGLKSVYKRLSRVANTDVLVLLTGETGVGKDVFARELHLQSQRYKSQFIKVDCSCIPESLMESEFFGYDPGAFSGASSKGKIGFFEVANSGTIFLDEIGELPLHLQAKLLRVLQDKEIVKVGSTNFKKVDVRIIAATNRDLGKEVEAGLFRSDLFYRLKVAEIKIPPLRERPEDIKPLVEFFLIVYSHKYKCNMEISPKAMEALGKYSWPGNVREIENAILSLIVTCEKNIAELKDLPDPISSKCEQKFDSLSLSEFSLEGRSLQEIMGALEKKVIMDVLDRFGSIGEAAKHLKVDRTTIFRKLKKFQIIQN